MGAGNFSLANAESVYIDDSQLFGDTDEELDHDLFNINYDEVIDTLRTCLPTSFSNVEGEWHEGGRVIAESSFYKIVVTGWVNYLAVSVLLQDNDDRYDWGINPLAAHHHYDVSIKFFDKIHELYPLRVATSAWTSGSYVPQATKAA